MYELLLAIWNILTESSFYLLLGFGLSGIMHVVLQRRPGFMNPVSGQGTKAVLAAAIFGAPLPLCSCGVVPAALTLRRHGAGKGATVSFLISCPETDFVSILLTYALLGPFMALYRPIAAVITAIVAGITVNTISRESPTDPISTHAGCHDDTGEQNNSPITQAVNDGPKDKGNPILQALRYGYVSFFDDIIGSLLLGIVLGGLLTTILPRFGLEQLGGVSSLPAMLVMLAIGIPMYVCATASTPIAAGLIAAGLSPGTALVFLLAGPATNLGSLLVLHRYLGKTVLSMYLACIAIVSIATGLALDALLLATSRHILPSTAIEHHHGTAGWKIATAVVLLLLTAFALLRRISKKAPPAEKTTEPAARPKCCCADSKQP